MQNGFGIFLNDKLLKDTVAACLSKMKMVTGVVFIVKDRPNRNQWKLLKSLFFVKRLGRRKKERKLGGGLGLQTSRAETCSVQAQLVCLTSSKFELELGLVVNELSL